MVAPTLGVCDCDAGWKGPECASLDLLPVRRAAPGWTQASPNRPSWGGATVFVQRRDGEDERAPFLERVGRERWGDVDDG